MNSRDNELHESSKYLSQLNFLEYAVSADLVWDFQIIFESPIQHFPVKSRYSTYIISGLITHY